MPRKAALAQRAATDRRGGVHDHRQPRAPSTEHLPRVAGANPCARSGRGHRADRRRQRIGRRLGGRGPGRFRRWWSGSSATRASREASPAGSPPHRASGSPSSTTTPRSSRTPVAVMLDAARLAPARRRRRRPDALRRPPRGPPLGRTRAGQARHRRRPPGRDAGGRESDHQPLRGVRGDRRRALFRREMLDQVGGFDELLRLFRGRRPRLARAQPRVAGPVRARAVVYHHHSATAQHGSPAKLYLVGRNRVRTLAKNATAGMLASAGLGCWCTACRSRRLASLSGRTPWRPCAGARGACASGGGTGAAVAPHRRPLRLQRPLGFRRALQRHKRYTETEHNPAGLELR